MRSGRVYSMGEGDSLVAWGSAELDSREYAVNWAGLHSWCTRAQLGLSEV